MFLLRCLDTRQAIVIDLSSETSTYENLILREVIGAVQQEGAVLRDGQVMDSTAVSLVKGSLLTSNGRKMIHW